MKVLIVDDEQLARDRLRRMVERIDGHTVIGEAANGEEAVAQVVSLNPDIVLLDIRMPGVDGLAAANRIAEQDNPPAVIFCTAYGEYALEAFEAQAVGYILKPVSQNNLEDALNKAQRVNKVQLASLSVDGPTGAAETENSRQNIAVKTRQGIELIDLRDIRCFIADHKYVTLYHVNGEALIDETLKDLENEFPSLFVRVHRNALVALKHIEGLGREEQGHYRVRLAGIEQKPAVSRRHVAEIRKLVQNL